MRVNTGKKGYFLWTKLNFFLAYHHIRMLLPIWTGSYLKETAIYYSAILEARTPKKIKEDKITNVPFKG